MRAKYVLSEVAVGLWRNISMTIAMIITMSVSLTMLGAGVLLYFQVQSMENEYKGDIQILVYLDKKLDKGDDQTEQVRQSLQKDKASGLVDTFEFKTKAQAYREFKELFKNAPDLVQNTDPDRLPANFGVKLTDMSLASKFESKYSHIKGVERVFNQRDSLDKVFGLLGGVQKLALIVALVQGIAALLLVANTIQVAAYSKRREVSIMKLVGASNWFVQAPFVLEAVFAGMLGSIVAFLALVAAKAFLVDGTFKNLFAILTPMPWSRVILMLPILAGVASLISAITGWVTLRFQVKV
ncbi:MAG TPA: permease-like cell division protein FtsX [Stackebrandtia sp.]|jgi:cell division transport system permease protein|uniref:permease-like cell division protein FtsX n=1 Tax=Stackebrandtia sp. TaxID=2023065 RepID=UPI002D70B87B|nr:permease-like cell division protein FtsX [Stackebrandtia sp.]HZE41301.1 permease-like cell division protein FtsX [Stackebrandtia sp.]